MGALYKLLYLALIINVPDAAVAAELCACGLHSLRQLLREVIALLIMYGPERTDNTQSLQR